MVGGGLYQHRSGGLNAGYKVNMGNLLEIMTYIVVGLTILSLIITNMNFAMIKRFEDRLREKEAKDKQKSFTYSCGFGEEEKKDDTD